MRLIVRLVLFEIRGNFCRPEGGLGHLGRMPEEIAKSAREHAKAQWTINPCGSVEGDETELAYFENVERLRYAEQDWQHEYFGFGEFAGKNVLEIGVGHGTDLIQFARGGAKCHAIDITQKHIDLAKRNFALRGFPVVIESADATRIPFPDEHFDCVYSFGVLHHIPEIDRCVAEINRVLKPGGVFYMALYYKWSSFHIVSKILVQGLLKGDLFRLGYNGLLATIEKGADGRSVCPYVRLFSAADVRRLLSVGWTVPDVSVWQLKSDHLSKFSLVLPRFIRRHLNRKRSRFGWYVASTATKSISPPIAGPLRDL